MRPGRRARIEVGTSGWHYPHWRGPFYPRELASAEWLTYYAERLGSVEVNNTYYKMPEIGVIHTWRDSVADGFRFAIKAPGGITHRRKLRNCEPLIEELFARLAHFRDRLGPVLFQLPPRWHANPARLDAFLRLLPRGRRYAFEPRDPSWHTEEVLAVLREHDAAFCIHDIGGVLSELHVTTDLVYVRLHGPGETPYTGSYAYPTLRTWAGRLRRWAEREGRDVCLYFDNDEAGHAAANAQTLRSLLESEGANVGHRAPHRPPTGEEAVR